MLFSNLFENTRFQKRRVFERYKWGWVERSERKEVNVKYIKLLQKSITSLSLQYLMQNIMQNIMLKFQFLN